EGARLLDNNSALRTLCGSDARAHIVMRAFSHYFTEFNSHHALDVYVFCLSLHHPQNKDGVLSMWRAYGGSGNGAALVFNTSFVAPRPESPLIITKVHYATREQRLGWLKEKIDLTCELLRTTEIPDDS